MTTHVDVVIVGGGISGLVCAHALRKAGIDAQLLEASAHAGGMIRTERRDGYLLEFGPQSFSATAALLSLCSELEVADRLVVAPAKAPRYVLVERKLQPVPLSPPAMLASSLLSGATKWTFARDLLGHTHPPEDDESVAAFVRRKFTPQLLDRLVGPFVSGIYAGDPERLSLRAAFPQLYEAEQSAASVVRGMIRAAKAKSRTHRRERPTLLSFRNGNETLVRALATNLGPALRTACEVTAIAQCGQSPTPKFFVGTRENGRDDVLTASRVVLATPTNVTAKLLRDIQPAFQHPLNAIEYAPLAVVSLGYRCADVADSLDGFGFLIPRSSGLSTLGAVWNSSLFPGRAPKNHVLLTSFVGGATNPQAANQPPDALAALVHREIGPLLSISHSPVFSNVQIYPRALPQYNLGHSERLATLEKLRADIPNLWLIGNYLRGPSIGACVEHSLAIATEILNFLH